MRKLGAIEILVKHMVEGDHNFRLYSAIALQNCAKEGILILYFICYLFKIYFIFIIILFFKLTHLFLFLFFIFYFILYYLKFYFYNNFIF